MKRSKYLRVKRYADCLLAVLAVLLLWPLFLAICVAIKLDSKGSVFFTQKRVGYAGRLFDIYKFRTMYSYTPRDVPTHMLKDPDEYITGIGAFLRRTSLDELPQIINIIKGDMSIVGPRPCVVYELGDYATLNKRFKKRFEVIAGLTGYAQCQGRNELEWDVKADFDNRYIDLYKKWGILLDGYIVFKTVAGVFQHTDIYESKTDTNISDELSAEQAQQRVVELAHQQD